MYSQHNSHKNPTKIDFFNSCLSMAAIYNMSSDLSWSVHSQNITIYNWADQLRTWNDHHTMSHPIRVVIENLDSIVASLNGHYTKYPASYFKKYLNSRHESEGLKWLIYECTMLHSRSYYVNTFFSFMKEFTDDVELDTTFPVFPGSPGDSMTVREFLEANLRTNALDTLELLPKLTPIVRNSKKYVPIEIVFIRSPDGDTEGTDERMTIRCTGDHTYSITYKDPNTSGIKSTICKTVDLSGDDVIKHLSISLRLMTYDSDPYDCVQIMAPGVPTVMIKTSDMSSSTRELIYDTVEITMKNWPVLLS